MKKSSNILGLPIISITEGRELGMSKTLVIDAKNGLIAAITIEDEEWYRGVKLIPYNSIIAIGDDAITILHSNKILKLSQVGDFEAMLDENIKILGTKAITKTGTIRGKISEIFVGDNGKIEKCEIQATDGSVSEVSADNISIFGKQVTVIDPDGVKKNFQIAEPAPAEVDKIPPEESVQPDEEIPPVELPPVEENVEPVAQDEEKADEPVEDESDEDEEIEEPDYNDFEPEPAEKVDTKEKVDTSEKLEPKQKGGIQQAEALKAAIKRAMENQQKTAPAAPQTQPPKKNSGKIPLIGRKITKTITADNGSIIIEAGAEITEEVLQKAKISNKLIEISMNSIA